MRLAYNPQYQEIDDSNFKKCDWSEFYWDASKAMLEKTLEPRGKEVDICMLVDSDHAEGILQIQEWLLDMCEHCFNAVVL